MVRSSLVLIFLMMAPLLTWGFSLQDISSFKQQALAKNLDQSSAWLKLGHYRKSLSGKYKSPIRGEFFIDQNGANDPKAELLATIDVLFDSKTSISQCKYLARTSWLKNTFDIDSSLLEKCPERAAWKDRLGATEAHLIFAASDLSSAPSSFGHTFLRLHNPKNTGQLDLLDYGINYAANTGTEDGALYAMKGLFGFYPGTYSMLPYHQKIQEYSNLEGRDLWEYKLNLSPAQVEFMIDHLIELDKAYAPYYFVDENCSSQMLELIEAASPNHNLTDKFHDMVIPLDTLKVLNSQGLLLAGKLRTSLQTEWRTRYAQLNFAERAALHSVLTTKSDQSHSYRALSKKEKAETLEAALSYLSIQEYREGKEYNEDKYKLSISRAKLGAITDPVTITPPKSPLLSPSTAAFYLGYGKNDEDDYYQFKYRRGFHDLLSDDSGLAPFSQLNFLTFDLRYAPSEQNWDLYQFVFLSAVSTSPWTQLEKPISWTMEVGTEPKLNPYVNGGVGASFDFPLMKATRWSLFAVSENSFLTNIPQPFLGAKSMFMMKWLDSFCTLFQNEYLYSTVRGEFQWNHLFAGSLSIGTTELRLEAERKDRIDQWGISVVLPTP
ncbi:DUF4105 domain-containing protein [Bdellovibrio sp. SKB1291214]|uniref:Lnb N-terminal periplasmic domain-containing protein n=1 Tax=Bdellovibrio sp. SKB1291214 TaxID=1732569 RepID=UPI000B516922|nr:DUF4105 domain-containing protein [Bdellovibrio sp. SKB1291214]UYL10415.1 DUF4105 domain-containing protein [Bdellovibrio sp. SKB1291214]